MGKFYKQTFWGVILITLGILLLLKQFGLIHFYWHTLWQLWPLIFIFWGISLLPVDDYLKLVISVIFLALGFYILFRYGQEPGWFWKGDMEWW